MSPQKYRRVPRGQLPDKDIEAACPLRPPWLSTLY
jgi:hypothetical protein